MPVDAVAVAFVAALGGALYGILLGFAIHRILGAYIEGAIGAAGCVVAGGLLLVLALAVLMLHSLPLFALMILLVGLSPLLSRRAEIAEKRRYYDERIQQYIDAIAADPRNLAARSSLADALHKRGYLDEAIEQYTELLRQSPRSHEETYRLKHLIQERDERRDPSIACPSCGRTNPRSRLHCAHCEASLAPVDRLREWLSGPTYKQLIRMFAITAGVITLIVLLGSILTPVGKILAIGMTILVLCIWFLVTLHVNP